MAIYGTLFEHLKKAENDSIIHFAEIRSMAITEWCRRAKDLAKQITSRTRIREELEKYNKRKIDSDQLIVFTLPKLKDAMSLSDEIVGILRLDVNNQVVTGCGYGSKLSQYINGLAKFVCNGTVLCDPIVIDGQQRIIVSAPIRNRIGERQGTDLVIIAPVLLKEIVSIPEESGNTSQIVVGYWSGKKLLPLFAPQEKGHLSKSQDILNTVQDFIAMAIEGKAGLVNTADLAVAYHPINECDWGLAITRNQHELYLPIYEKMAVIGSLSLAIYLVILSVFWFLLKPLAGRILMHTDELEKKVQEKTAVLHREIADRKKAELDKEEKIVELREAMLKIKTLGGMLPICSICKKIRDDQGYWNQIESYIREHSEAEFSHSICPECAKKLYPDLKLRQD